MSALFKMITLHAIYKDQQAIKDLQRLCQAGALTYMVAKLDS